MSESDPTVDSAALDSAVRAAAAAAPRVAAADPETRARWLEAAATALDAVAPELAELADTETHLGLPRLTGEVARTTGQLRLFAAVLRDGAHLEAIIDHATPDATPPGPDLRRMLVPLGPVAVYAASNFPFAFSVAGGDTASALAAGNPVVVKTHPGHPRTSARTAEVVTAALEAAGAPEGSFAIVEGWDAGVALVQHPLIAAAGFTGSLSGGRALFDLAQSRPEPIPFYGELSSLNPVVVTAAALAERRTAIAEGLAGSFTLGVGQFCTKPGLVLVPAGSEFEDELAARVPAGSVTLLTDRIRDGFSAGLQRLTATPGVRVLGGDPSGAAPVALATTVADVRAHPEALLEECFGPVTVVAAYRDDAERDALIAELPGSLTATVHAAEGEDVATLLTALGRRAGRVIVDGWPTGVAVGWAQHHGGPYPSTTSGHTSVGATAIRRFQRPLALQSVPARHLPPALRDENPLSIPRRVDGVLQMGGAR